MKIRNLANVVAFTLSRCNGLQYCFSTAEIQQKISLIWSTVAYQNYRHCTSSNLKNDTINAGYTNATVVIYIIKVTFLCFWLFIYRHKSSLQRFLCNWSFFFFVQLKTRTVVGYSICSTNDNHSAWTDDAFVIRR